MSVSFFAFLLCNSLTASHLCFLTTVIVNSSFFELLSQDFKPSPLLWVYCTIVNHSQISGFSSSIVVSFSLAFFNQSKSPLKCQLIVVKSKPWKFQYNGFKSCLMSKAVNKCLRFLWRLIGIENLHLFANSFLNVSLIGPFDSLLFW